MQERAGKALKIRRRRKDVKKDLEQCAGNQTFLEQQINEAKRNGENRKANRFKHLLKDEKRWEAELVEEYGKARK